MAGMSSWTNSPLRLLVYTATAQATAKAGEDTQAQEEASFPFLKLCEGDAAGFLVLLLPVAGRQSLWVALPRPVVLLLKLWWHLFLPRPQEAATS